MINELTKQQQETLFMNDIDANAYRQMKETSNATQHQFCEQYIKSAKDEVTMLLFQSVLEQILKQKKHTHMEMRDEVYSVFSDTEMDDCEF